MNKFLLTLIVLSAAFLRLAWLDSYPVGFTADEVQQGYDAFSILKTGKDHWGEPLPLFPRGFGDYKPPLYTYLTIPSVAIFGLSEFSTRLPAALSGIALILVIYHLSLLLFKNQKIALLSAALLAINPWQIQITRSAFEGGAGILVFTLGILFWLKSETNKKYLLVSVIFFGLTLYSYHSYRLITPLFLGALSLPYLFKKTYKKIIPGVLLFLVLAIPLMLNFDLILKRSSDVSIISSDFIQSYLENRATSGPSPFFSKAFDNKFFYIAGVGFNNYLSYFSPYFFFTGSRPNNNYLNFPNTPLYFGIEIVTVFLGVFFITRRKEKWGWLLLAWAVIAPIPAALTDSFNANRAVTFVPLLTIISSYGLYELIKVFYDKKLYLINLLIFLIFSCSFVSFLYTYLYKLPNSPPDNLRYGFNEVFPKILSIENKYQTVKFSRGYSMAHIYVAFYSANLKNGITPEFVQAQSKDWLRYEAAGKHYVDQIESYNLGKFIFGSINLPEDMKVENSLIVGSEDNFPSEFYKSIYDKYSPEGKIIFRFIETEGVAFEKRI